VGIIASGHTCLGGEIFTARIIRDDGDPSPAPDPLVVLHHVVARVGELDLLGPEGDGDLGTMLQEVTALRDMGRVRGGAYGQLQPQLDGKIRGLLLQGAEDPFFLLRVFIVDVIADPGLEIGGDLGAAPPQLSLGALGEMGPLEAQGWELIGG